MKTCLAIFSTLDIVPSVWRQLSCPVRVNYPVWFLVKN